MFSFVYCYKGQDIWPQLTEVMDLKHYVLPIFSEHQYINNHISYKRMLWYT